MLYFALEENKAGRFMQKSSKNESQMIYIQVHHFKDYVFFLLMTGITY